jgi:hypothetical protein
MISSIQSAYFTILLPAAFLQPDLTRIVVMVQNVKRIGWRRK